MMLRVLIATVVLAVCWQVRAEIRTVEAAVETVAANLRLPVSDNGRLSFRPCDEICSEDYLMARLTPATRFIVGGSVVEYLEFRTRFYNLKPGSDVYTLVQYDVTRSTVTSVKLGL